MATQRLTVAALAGDAAGVATALFAAWASAPDATGVDRFGSALRSHGLALPTVYFAEWADRWLTGDAVPGPAAVAGRRFEIACLSPAAARARAGRRGDPSPEWRRLSWHLREAAAGRGGVAAPLAVVIAREVVGPSATDDEVKASLARTPNWLSQFTRHI